MGYISTTVRLERLVFFTDMDTLEKFEASLKFHARFCEPRDEPNILIPMQTGMENWPILIGREKV